MRKNAQPHVKCMASAKVITDKIIIKMAAAANATSSLKAKARSIQ